MATVDLSVVEAQSATVSVTIGFMYFSDIGELLIFSNRNDRTLLDTNRLVGSVVTRMDLISPCWRTHPLSSEGNENSAEKTLRSSLRSRKWRFLGRREIREHVPLLPRKIPKF